MSFMNVLIKADGSEIHADVWWAFDAANKNEQFKFDKSILFRADRLLEVESRTNDNLDNILRSGFFTGKPSGLDAVALEKGKRKFINKINAVERTLKPEVSSLERLKEGSSFDLRDLQEDESELYNFLFEGDDKPLEKIKMALGVRTDKSIEFAKQLKILLETWSKYGNNAKAKNIINDMRKNLASSSKLMQEYLLEGKGRLKADVSALFIPRGNRYEDGSWSEVREYNGKSSIDVLLEIYQFARIPVRKTGELEAGIKGVEQYYSLDVDKFVDEITELIQKKSADPADHYRLFFNSDNILRMIYRLVPDIVHTANEKMSEGERKGELEKQFDALEYLIRINTLTGDFSRLKESRLKSAKRIANKHRGSSLKMNRDFPHLDTAWELYEEDPSKYAPNAETKRTKTPAKVNAPTFGVRGTKYPDRYLGPKTLEESKTLEEKINEFSGKVKVLAEDAKSGNLPENPSQQIRLFTTTKDKLLELIKDYQTRTDNFKVSLQELVDGSNPRNIDEDDIEDDKKLLKEWIEYYEEELPMLTNKIEVLDRVLENLPTQQQSLDEPASEESPEASQ